jgi:hypothetical protein
MLGSMSNRAGWGNTPHPTVPKHVKGGGEIPLLGGEVLALANAVYMAALANAFNVFSFLFSSSI